jgi:ATP-binding cassette, subfamily C, bacterial
MSREADRLPIGTPKETWSFAARLLADKRGSTSMTALTFLLAGVAGVVPPWVLGKIVDDIRAGHDTVLVCVLLIAGAGVLAALFGGLSVLLLARVGEPALAQLREQVFSRALHLPSRDIERATSGDLLSRLSDDVRSVSDGLKTTVPQVVNAVVGLVFTIAGVAVLDWRLGLGMLTAAPLYRSALAWYLPRSRPLYRQQRIAQGERAEALLTGIHGAPTARAFGIETALLSRIDETSNRTTSISISVQRLRLGFLNGINLGQFTGLGMALCVGFFLVQSDSVSVGTVTAAALYSMRLFGPVSSLLFTFDQFQSMGAALSRLVGIARLPPGPPPRDVTVAGPGDIVLSGIGHEYEAGKPVLQDINIRIAVGERVALVGATGAGKTTLGAIAAGVLRPTHGTVRIGSLPNDPALSETRSPIFLVTQESHAFAGTVRELLTLARPEATEEEVRRALTATFADRWVDALPEGLGTVIGEHGYPLLPDQVQHLALSRVVLGDAWFVVLDEATAEAGGAGARVLEKAAAVAMDGRTAIVVAHRITQVRLTDRILVMHEGLITEAGTHDELLTLGGRYAELWQSWSGSEEERHRVAGNVR